MKINVVKFLIIINNLIGTTNEKHNLDVLLKVLWKSSLLAQHWGGIKPLFSSTIMIPKMTSQWSPAKPIHLPYISQDGGRMWELSVRQLGCNSCSLIKVGNHYVNLGIRWVTVAVVIRISYCINIV